MTKRTVYIVGAGASYEAGLPTGQELKNKIAQLLDISYELTSLKSGDIDITRSLRGHTSADVTNRMYNEYISECHYISANMPLAISIDNFIDANRGNDKIALCGKLAIIRSILDAEKNSKLNFNKNNERKVDFSSLESTWYLSFFRTLTENVNVQEIAERFKRITLIIFNYDRCVEHFLLFSLMSYYRINDAKASEIISNLTIIHPYGIVGLLPWLQHHNNQSAIEFGGKLPFSELILYAKSIRTFTEGAHEAYMDQLKEKMRDADRLIFLGFAFHPLNMQLLGSGEINGGYENEQYIRCYATALGTSKADQKEIENLLSNLYKNKFKVASYIENITCKQIFLDYSRNFNYM